MVAPSYNESLRNKRAQRRRSAEIILAPLFTRLSPRSVLDVGCGHGAWLAVAQELGVHSIVGVDGPWIDQTDLMIPAACVHRVDLEQPLDLRRRFDFVICLEVVEHLPPSAGDILIDSLVRHGEVILFSGAVPHQGGRGHVNEQFQSHWARKFVARGYAAIDLVRPEVWGDDRVLWWLQQNVILYVTRSRLAGMPDVAAQAVPDPEVLSLVHPELYLRWVHKGQKGKG